MDEELIKGLLSNMKCGVCGQHYERNHVRVLGHQEALLFVDVFCPSCQRLDLVAAVIWEGKAIAAVIREGGAVEPVAELSEAESNKFSIYPPIGTDDVLDIHTFLEEFSGDFSSLFSER